jgi:hypothetical protein
MSAVSPGVRRSEDERVRRWLTAVFFTAVAVSVVHYADNYFNYDAFPQSPTASDPSAPLIPVAWVIFTAVGVTGYLRFRRRADGIALLLLAFYAGSGLIGIGHYTVPGALDMPWWRQAHVVADILLGGAILLFAGALAARRRGSA